MIDIKKILAPTDLSDFSKHAVRYAREFASAFGAEVHLLHVIDEPLTTPDELLGVPVPESDIRDLERAAEAGLERISQDEGISAQRVISFGTPFVSIVRYARENDIDLIVLGTHGRTGLSHALIGSTAEKVVRKAPCPVLTVRPEGHDFVMP